MVIPLDKEQGKGGVKVIKVEGKREKEKVNSRKGE